MRRVLAVLAALAVMLCAAPAAERGGKLAPSHAVVGLPVFSSDGRQIGRILATGVGDDNRPVLVAEIERPLGMGADAVAIPSDMFTRQSDRIVLTITAEEVNERISGAGRGR